MRVQVSLQGLSCRVAGLREGLRVYELAEVSKYQAGSCASHTLAAANSTLQSRSKLSRSGSLSYAVRKSAALMSGRNGCT